MLFFLVDVKVGGYKFVEFFLCKGIRIKDIWVKCLVFLLVLRIKVFIFVWNVFIYGVILYFCFKYIFSYEIVLFINYKY